MNCRQARDLLPLYADDDLESTTQAMVAEHLQGCPACRARLELDIKLAAALTAYTPAADTAAARTTLRSKVMAEVDQERRRQPIRRAVLRLGNAASWAVVSGIAAVLVLGIAIAARPLAERAWRGQTPASTPAPAPAGIGWQVVREQVIASPYYWAVEGQSADRTPQISPDGSKIAYLPAVDGQATDVDRLVVRDLATGKDLDLTPEEGFLYTSVRWSPDSRSLAFVKYGVRDGQGTPSELWRIDADGANAKLLYQRGPCSPGGAGPALGIVRWSADGQYIEVDSTIFDCLGSDSALRVRTDGSGNTEPITYPAPSDFGARDDALVAATLSPSDDYVLATVRSDGLLEPPKDAPAGGQSLVLYDLKSRQRRVLGSFAGTIDYIDGSDISPDGEWICFTVAGNADGSAQELPRLWTVRRDGAGLREVKLNGDVSLTRMPGPLWAGGGRAYFNQPPEVSAIWICELDATTGEAGLIGHKEPARDLVSVSRDGRRLLIVRGGGNDATLLLLELAPRPASAPTVTPAWLGAAPERLVLHANGQGDAVEPGVPVFAPLAAEVERVLLAARPGAATNVADPAQQAERIKAQQVAVEAVYPAPGVSVGGQGPFTMALIPLDMPESGEGLTVFLGNGRDTLALSADAGEALAMLRRILGVRLPAAEAPAFGPARDLFTPPETAGFYRVSPDGAWVLFPVPGDGRIIRPHLEAYATSSGYATSIGEVITLVIPAAESQLSGGGQYTWFPDSRRLLVCTGGDGGEILIKELGPEPARTLLKAPQGSYGFGGAAISPDGWRIAYTVIYPADPAPVPRIGIEVLELDGSGHRQVVVEPDFFVGNLAWTPDGSQLVYFKGEGGTPPEGGKAYVVGADNAPAPALPQPVIDNARLAAWSPSGKQALWMSEPADEKGKADLYLSAWPPVGEPQLVAQGVAMAGAVWAGSDDWFVYSKDGALYLAQNGGREQLVRLTAQGEVADAPLWVPGKGLIYRVARNGRAALRLLPLIGAEPAATVTPGAEGQAQVELDLSGSAPPSWELTAAQVEELVSLLSGLERTNLPLPQPAGPGYSGFRLTRLSTGHTALPERLHVVGGVVEVQNGGEAYHLADPERRLERWLLESGRAAMGDALCAQVAAAIAQDTNAAPGSFKAFHMVDAQTGWALAERAVLRTTDGGDTWADVTPQGIATPKVDGNVHWGGQHFPDADHAWVAMNVGSNLTFLRTADGGRTWSVARLPVLGMGAQFTSLDAQRGWALVGQGVAAGSERVAVLGTEDGGATWALLNAADPENPWSGNLPLAGNKLGIAFRDATHGWLPVFVPVNGTVLVHTTQDGGRTWTPQTPALPVGYEDAQATPQAPVFFNAQEGVLTVGLYRQGPEALFYITRDGGVTWDPTAPISAATGGQIVSTFISVDEGWALVAPVPGETRRLELRHTADGGRTWTALTSDPALEGLIDLQFVDSRHGWALCTGEQGTVLLKTTDGGRTWARAE